MFGFIRAFKRKKLAKRPFPKEWEPYLAAKMPFLPHLSEAEAQQLRTVLKIFVWEKYWIGAGGLEVTEEMKVVVATAAAELARGLALDAYDHLTEIVLYPSHYVHPDQDGVVFGEAHRWGTVVLSWDAVEHGLANRDDGHNTALHELAHVLDNADGTFDGTPLLHHSRDYQAWVKACSEHFLKLQNKPQKSVVRRYGATNEAEFFACATEAFFEKPQQMLKKAPDLYAVLKQFYRVDPVNVGRGRSAYPKEAPGAP